MHRKYGRYNLPWKKGVFLKPVFHQSISRIKEIRKSIERSLESKAADLKFYALATGDGTDATDAAQLAIFIRRIDNKYITEEMASLVPLKDITWEI